MTMWDFADKHPIEFWSMCTAAGFLALVLVGMIVNAFRNAALSIWGLKP